jgi:adenosylcobyric acid synthase
MVLGTASHVGKSIMTAALCRIFADEGVRVAPFKAQNMSLNSAATPDGREIGRAQALQAEACRIPASVDMNPVLIKPSSDTGSQIVLLGRVWGQVTAADYHTRRVEQLFPAVIESYQRLASQYDLIVLEGAGSPSEINLMAHDIVNLRMAEAAGAACLLVGDIDRGGVFASLLGTLELLESRQRALIRGYAINKFRGDVSLLRPGIEMMAPRLKIPCAGIIPYLHNLGLDEEDGVAVEDRRAARRVWNLALESVDRPLRVAVVALPHMSNFTDFDPLAAEPSVALAYVTRSEELEHADVIVLPGSKQTIDDLEWLDRSGLASLLIERQKPTIGICGGFQMLGTRIDDPAGIENGGRPGGREGLGLLPTRTVLTSEKVTRPVTGKAPQVFGQPLQNPEFRGYEIHVGETVYAEGAERFAEIGAKPDGAVSPDGRVLGTYSHGIFDDDAFRHSFVNAARAACGLAPASGMAFVAAEREARLDRLAAHVRAALDIGLIRSWIE